MIERTYRTVVGFEDLFNGQREAQDILNAAIDRLEERSGMKNVPRSGRMVETQPTRSATIRYEVHFASNAWTGRY